MIAIGIGAALAVVGVAEGGLLLPTTSDRFVSVTNRESLPTTTVSVTGPALGPWLATAFKTNNDFNDPNYNPFGSPLAVTSRQQSDFGTTNISFSGFIFIDYTGIMPPNNGCSAINRAFMSFHLAAPCDYQLATTFTPVNSSETSGSVGLFQWGSPLFTHTASGNRSGTLPAGDYELRILITGSSGGPTLDFDSRLQIDTVFSVPAPGGVAGVGVVALALCRRRRPAMA